VEIQSDRVAVAPFKQCNCCGASWQTRAEFLADPGVMLIGYQSHFEELATGLFLFNHACGTTFAVEVGAMRDLYTGPVFRDRVQGSEACLGLCNRRESLDICPLQCECAFVREIMQVIRRWPKHRAA
jgi:hypothetical protein